MLLMYYQFFNESCSTDRCMISGVIYKEHLNICFHKFGLGEGLKIRYTVSEFNFIFHNVLYLKLTSVLIS